MKTNVYECVLFVLKVHISLYALQSNSELCQHSVPTAECCNIYL